jgi:hypothetical protein
LAVPHPSIPRAGLADAAPRAIEGELLPPAAVADDAGQERWVKLLSMWTDNAFEVPGLGWRFGLDPIIGLVPVVGDLTSVFVSLYILSIAAQLRVPRSTLARMMLNIGIDYTVGSIPVVGNIFDFAWKANYRNAQLLKQTLAMPVRQRRRQTFWDWLFIGGMVLGLIGILIGSLIAAILLARWIITLVHA